ncbi:MAG: alanine racemase [Hyphomicrobiaceae bacterium]
MPLDPPAALGQPLADVDTPALLVDLDAFEGNLQRMADFAGKAGVRLRPHAKTHKSPEVARRQIALGAVGVCCQKVAEAEIMVAGGIDNVLVSNEVAGARKLARLAALAQRAKIGICVDNADNIEEIERAAAGHPECLALNGKLLILPMEPTISHGSAARARTIASAALSDPDVEQRALQGCAGAGQVGRLLEALG